MRQLNIADFWKPSEHCDSQDKIFWKAFAFFEDNFQVIRWYLALCFPIIEVDTCLAMTIYDNDDVIIVETGFEPKTSAQDNFRSNILWFATRFHRAVGRMVSVTSLLETQYWGLAFGRQRVLYTVV